MIRVTSLFTLVLGDIEHEDAIEATQLFEHLTMPQTCGVESPHPEQGPSPCAPLTRR
jgi:hypothetical protein